MTRLRASLPARRTRSARLVAPRSSVVILAHGTRERCHRALAPLERADLLDAQGVQEADRLAVAEADLLGQVGVGGERETGAGLDAHLGEGARRIELAHRLAQARCGDLDGDAALGDRLDRGLVEEPGI